MSFAFASAAFSSVTGMYSMKASDPDQPGECSASVSITDRVTWSGRFRAPFTISVPCAEALFRFRAKLCPIPVTPVK